MFITLPLPKRSIKRKPMEGLTRWVWTHSRGALMGVAVLTACGGSPFEPELGLADFDVVWEEVESRYPHFQLKGIDWSSVRTNLRPRMEEASSGAEIESIIVELLAALRDPHVWLDASDGRINPYLSHRSVRDAGAFDLDLATGRIVGDVTSAAEGRVIYGTLGANLGYIYIKNFRDGEVDSGAAEALDALQGTSGLIVDVRGNQGGSQDEITRVVGRFTSDTFAGLPTFILGEQIQSPTVTPRGAVPYSNPTVVLIDGTCFSACESFAEMLTFIASVRSLGDTTAGGGGGFSAEAPGVIRMPSGVESGVPTAELRRYDGTSMEWLGVPPDIKVAQSRSDAEAGIDRQLDAAILLLLGVPSVVRIIAAPDLFP